jgi:hypothetical protein
VQTTPLAVNHSNVPNMKNPPIDRKALFSVVSFVAVIMIIAALAQLTFNHTDPCANPQGDISAAVLGAEPDDQDALVNRALIVKGECESK